MLNNLEELPEFEQASPFDGITHNPIYEIALITYKPTTQNKSPYVIQEVIGVVGRSSDSKELFITREWMKRTDDGGQITATHSVGPRMFIEMISSYEVLVPNSKVTSFRTTHRI